jgi:hypothetical protein
MTPRRSAAAAGLAFVSMLSVACAAINIGSFVERGYEFWTVKTFEWAPADHLSTGDPRLDNNEVFQRYVTAAIARELTRRGFERVDAGQGDVVVHYHASVTQRIDMGGLDARYEECEDCRPSVFDAGTLTIDLVDAGMNQLVWRGWAERSITGVLDRQDLMEQEVNLAVEKILARLPVPLVATR